MNAKKKSVTYSFAAVATDMAIFTIRNNELMVLLIKMKKKPFTDMWALPGGLIGPKESLDTAAARILLEKTGVAGVYLEQLAAFGDISRDPFGRVVSIAYMALIPSNEVVLQTTGEYADVAWFPHAQASSLAYDHDQILRQAVSMLKQKMTHSSIAASLLPKSFTLTELQSVYEVVLEKALDKRNFRKKLLALGIVKPTGKKRTGGTNRPAALYSMA